MFRKLVLLTALVTVSAPASARADTFYGGSGLRKQRIYTVSISLAAKDNGTVAGRLAFGFSCGKHSDGELVAHVAGRLNGSAFTAKGSTRLRGVGKLRWTLTGTVTPDAATGKARLRAAHGCSFTRDFVVRTASAPAGAPAKPAPGTSFHGLTPQVIGGLPLAVSVQVAGNGRVYSIFSAAMNCHGKVIPIAWTTPTTNVHADGSFSRTEKFTAHYRGGYSERYRMTFTGRFLSDGAAGTLRIRMQAHKHGTRYSPCDSGTQSWGARS
jgi:hypothetical protein